MTTQRKQFTPEFKTEIAKLMVDQNYTIQQACEASGAGDSAVRRWRNQYISEKQGQPLANTKAITPEQIEIQQLKQRVRQLEAEREILKKASAFFAQEMR
jgi:transposase